MKRHYGWLVVWLCAAANAEDAVVVSTDTEAVDAVVVSLSRKADPRKKWPTNVSLVGARDLERINAVTVDEGLGSVPSVLVQKSGVLGSFSTVRLRGAPASSQQQILIDDLPLQGVSNQFFDFSQIPAWDVERVEVVRGGGSALYGANAIGGVVNIVPKRYMGDAPLTRLRALWGAFLTQVYEVDFNVRRGPTDARVSGGRYLTDGFQDNQDADTIHAQARLGVTAGSGARFSADLGVVGSEAGNPRGTLLEVSEWDGKKERTALEPSARTKQRTIRAHAKGFLPTRNGGWHTTFFGSQQGYKLLPAAGASPDFHQNNRIAGNDTRWTGSWLTVGGAFERDEQWTAADAFAAERSNHITNRAGYIQGDWKTGPVRWIPALRHDRHSAFGGVWNPRFTGVWTAAPGWKVSVNAARSHRAPSFLELYYKDAFFSGNPALNPERAWSIDAGTEWRPGKTSRLSVTGFFTRITDRVTVNGTFSSYENAPRAELSGVEVENRHRIFPRWTGAAAYTHTRAVGNSLASSRYVPLRLTPRHVAYYQVAGQFGDAWEWANTLLYRSGQFERDDEKGLTLPPFAVWNTRLSKRLLASELFVAVDNILDRRYAETFDNDPLTFQTSRNPQPGRRVSVGVSVEFQD